MINFGIVVFSSKEEVKKKGFIANLILRISIYSKKSILKYIDINTLHLYQNLAVSIIKLPFSIEEYFNFKDKNNKKIVWELSEIMKKQGLASCLFPLKFLEQNHFKSFDGSYYNKRDLFKLLAIKELEYILQKVMIHSSKPNILIINNNDAHELDGALNIAAKHSNYIFVYSKDTRIAEDIVNVFKVETGSGAVITDDLENAIKIADVIINYADSDKVFENIKLKNTAIIFNFGEGYCNKIESNNVVINDIDISNDNLIKKMPSSIWDWFSKREFMNTVFAHFCMNYPGTYREYPNYQTLKVFDKIFEKSEFKFVGYYQRNNFTKL